MAGDSYSFRKSREMMERGKRVIPEGSQNTRLPLFDDFPVFFGRAKGCRMWDVDGNEFIDLLASIGPIICGYAYDAVDEAAREVMATGFQSSMNPPVMIELAEKLVEIVPSAEVCRFFKTGSEATHAAVRTARHYTGREKVARRGYHGWFDMWWPANAAGIHAGSTGPVVEFDGTAENLEDTIKTGGFAAVIICPTEVKFTEENFQGIIDVAHRYGAVAIFDEVKTGFRASLGGVQQLMGVTPDITTLSKAMANGYPMAAVVGSREVAGKISETPTAGTFNVEALSMAASLATIRELELRDGPEYLDRLGRRFLDGLKQIIENQGVEADPRPNPLPCMPQLFFTDKDENRRQRLQDAFYGEVIKRGLFFVAWHMSFIMLSHTEADIDEALNICEDSLTAAGKLI